MHVNTVLFDLFNTLILLENDDAFYVPALKELHKSLVENGINISFEHFSETYFQIRNQHYKQTAKTLTEPHFNTRISKTLGRLGCSFSRSHPAIAQATEAFTAETMKYTRLDKDATYVLHRLRKTYKLGIVTNFSIPEFVPQLLQKYNIRQYFSDIVISGTINRRKPSLEIFQKALETLKARAETTVFIGDTLSVDIKGAQNAGLKTVLIERKPAISELSTTFYTQAAPTENIIPDRKIQSLKQLLAILKSP